MTSYNVPNFFFATFLKSSKFPDTQNIVVIMKLKKKKSNQILFIVEKVLSKDAGGMANSDKTVPL